MNSQSVHCLIILKLKSHGESLAKEASKEGRCSQKSLLLSVAVPIPKRRRRLDESGRPGCEGRALGLTGAHFQILHAVQQRVLLHLGLCQRHFGSRQLQFQTFVLLLQHLKQAQPTGATRGRHWVQMSGYQETDLKGTRAPFMQVNTVP